MKMRKIVKLNKTTHGITLISLVITVVVLIILAGVTMNFIIGENGILSKAKYAKEKTLIAQYEEQIELIKPETRLKYNDGLTIERLKKAFDEDNQKYWVNKTEIISDNEIEKIKLTTNDGYIFYITDITTEYKGKGTIEETPPYISADMVSYTPEDTSWQVDNVKDALDYLFNN